MAHARTTVRAEIVAALVAAGTPAGSRVYTEERVAHLADADLPAIRVLLQSENQERSSRSSGRYDALIQRNATVLVTYMCKQDSGFISATDGALALIEIALASLQSAVIKDITPQQVLFDIDSDGNQPLYTAQQQFEVLYITAQGDPATAF